MIDIGPNLSSEQFTQDLPQVIERAIQANVNGFILTSTDWKSFQKNLQIVEQYQSKTLIKTTYGLHPHYAHNDHTIFQNIEKVLAYSHIVALGEFGLDYFRMLTPKEKQIEYKGKISYLRDMIFQNDKFMKPEQKGNET